MSIITDDDIERFIDKYFRERDGVNNSILKNFKKVDIKSWASVIFSSEFQTNFQSEKQIKKMLGEDEIKIFEELFIMIPLNYIYWRDSLKYEELFPTTNQDGPVCWAHAIGSIIHLTLRRIISKKPPPFEDIKNDLVKEFGKEPNNVSKVLNKVLQYPNYNILHYQPVAEENVNVYNPHGSYHLYIARFYLTGEEWHDFSTFYANNKTGILTKNHLHITKPDEKYKKDAGGHAVVLIDHNKHNLTFLNSWGNNFADNGKFTIERGAINIEYFDIFWFASDLSYEEKNCYENRLKKAIEAFYHIIDYRYFLSTIDRKKK